MMEDNPPPQARNGAAPTATDEEELLREKFGEPNEEGIYGAVKEEE